MNVAYDLVVPAVSLLRDLDRTLPSQLQRVARITLFEHNFSAIEPQNVHVLSNSLECLRLDTFEEPIVIEMTERVGREGLAAHRRAKQQAGCRPARSCLPPLVRRYNLPN